jgi:arylsulfatase A-like enzyme
MLSAPQLKPEYVEALTYTTQIAPTILHALGLNPNKLDAVKKERTQVLGH